MENRDFDISDIKFGHSVTPEYGVNIIDGEPPSLSQRFKFFFRFHIMPALILTAAIGCYSFFIASIFKWVLLK